MKEVIKKMFLKKLWEQILVIFGCVAILDWIVFPGLSVSNTAYNLLSVFLTIIIIIFLTEYTVNYIKNYSNKNKSNN